MHKQLICGAVLAGVVVLATQAGRVGATPQSGFTASTISMGRFGDIDVANHMLRELEDSHPGKDLWLSLQRTKGPSDLYIQSNEWAVGGTTGWHTHPGHSLIIVTAGAVTGYDESCTPTVYAAGAAGSPNTGFVDAGGDHLHLLRNEGTVVARTIAVQLIPAGAPRRIDVMPAPEDCPLQ